MDAVSQTASGAGAGGDQLVDFSNAFCRARGMGQALMRKMRLEHRCGYIACTRLVLMRELEQLHGRRDPHW